MAYLNDTQCEFANLLDAFGFASIDQLTQKRTFGNGMSLQTVLLEQSVQLTVEKGTASNTVEVASVRELIDTLQRVQDHYRGKPGFGEGLADNGCSPVR
jgi:hypothetical protein